MNFSCLTVCVFLLLSILSVRQCALGGDDINYGVRHKDTRSLVYLAIVARNAAHLLPNYLGYIERLDYPKRRISVGIFTDPSVDNTTLILYEWKEFAQSHYASIELIEGNEEIAGDDIFVWTKRRLEYMARLRQRVLEIARRKAEYLFFVDCDNFLVNPQTLNKLMEAKKPIVAPMLIVNKETTYSNFWGEQNEKGYYKRSPEYIPIISRKKHGCFKVPLVHSTFLVDLRTKASEGLTYWPPQNNYQWNIDDIIIFSFSARENGMGMYILNTEPFGYLSMPKEYSSLNEAINETVNWKLKTIVNHVPIAVSQFISQPMVAKDTAGTDKVFLISLERRPERRNRMLACLNELQIDFNLFNAIDGRNLNQSYLDSLGIHFLPGWKDPWGERPMTMGEVGCFLSHYFIWLKMISEGLQTVLVLEDDIDFEPNFKQNIANALTEVETINSQWDLVYVGRKELNREKEAVIPQTNLVRPSYSYWTLGYIISLRGAEKLVAANPLANLLPVDEYIPIMFNQHSETEWMKFFPNRNLQAYSTNPLLVFPTHYVGDPEWFSDTEPPPDELEQIRQRKVKEEEEREKAKRRGNVKNVEL